MSQHVRSRIERLSIPEPNTGCWLWIGHLKSNGYGTLGIKHDGCWKTMHAHRVSYQAFVCSVPAGMDLDHKCRMRCCVNPDHLEPVSRSINLSRSPAMGRQSHKTLCPNGHQYSGVNSRGQRICHVCAAAASLAHYHRRQS